MRLLMPWENGVSTTQWMSGNFCLMLRATVKASLSAFPGMQMTRSIFVEPRIFSASSMVDTWVNVGG